MLILCPEMEIICHMEEEKDNIHEKSVLLFSDRGIVGVSNTEITPELAVKIGVSLGSMFRDGNIALSYDSDHASEMLISAIECGLKSTGVQVFMFGEQTLPITRSGIAYYRLTGGVHLNMSKTDDTFYSKLEFIDSSQANFDTKSKETLESIYTNENFVRVEPHEIKPSINLNNFKYFYTQNIFNSLKSDIFNINLKAWTKSKTVSELLEMLLHEIENRVLESSRHVEFFAEISENGETATFFTSDSHPLSGEQFFGIMSIILLNHAPSCQIVLPVSASDELKSVVLATGGTVVQSKISDAEFMKQVLKFGTPEQFKFCFNGIYATVTLLDYLNHNALSFDALVETLPLVNKSEIDIPCSKQKKMIIMSALKEAFKNEKIDTTDGLKIFNDKGWALIVPSDRQNYIKIISEGFNTEAATEISNYFENKIKMLANS